MFLALLLLVVPTSSITCMSFGCFPTVTVENDAGCPCNVVRAADGQCPWPEFFNFLFLSFFVYVVGHFGPKHQIEICLANLSDSMAAFYMLPRFKFDLGFSFMTFAA